MAMAGYNPNAAVSLWQKMQKASQGEPPKFFSTHPPSGDRIANLQNNVPKVMPFYTKAQPKPQLKKK
jgi:predicted Zn-dependent protease